MPRRGCAASSDSSTRIESPHCSRYKRGAMGRRILAIGALMFGAVVSLLDWWSRWDFIEQKAKDHTWLRPLVDVPTEEHIAAVLQFLSKPWIGTVIMLFGVGLLVWDRFTQERLPAPDPTPKT